MWRRFVFNHSLEKYHRYGDLFNDNTCKQPYYRLALHYEEKDTVNIHRLLFLEKKRRCLPEKV